MVALRAPQPDELRILFGAFAVYWVVDLVGRWVWPKLLPKELFKGPKPAIILGRHTMDVVACGLFIYLAWQAQQDPEFKALSEVTPMQRNYHGNPTCQILTLCQLAYQTKNLIDSYMCGDGALFYIHHICTGVLCIFGAYPFLHPFAPFFLGFVEISTAMLCLLGLFDDAHGVVGLGAMYPKTKLVLGACFAVCFIPIRCMIWPYLSYDFWKDMLAVMEAGPHSLFVVVYALVVNAGLTGLQFYWLFEIIQTGRRELGGLIGSASVRSKVE